MVTMKSAVLNFLLSTAHPSHAASIRWVVNKTPADAYDHLFSLGASISINEFIDRNPAPLLNAYKTFDAFQTDFLAWCAKIDEIDVKITPRSKIRALWNSFPRNASVNTLETMWNILPKGTDAATQSSLLEIFASLKGADLKPFVPGPPKIGQIHPHRRPGRSAPPPDGRRFGRSNGLINPDPPYNCP